MTSIRFSTSYLINYDRAIISLPNGEIIDGKVQGRGIYEGDLFQVQVDDKIYLVHSSRIVLIKEEEGEKDD